MTFLSLAFPCILLALFDSSSSRRIFGHSSLTRICALKNSLGDALLVLIGFILSCLLFRFNHFLFLVNFDDLASINFEDKLNNQLDTFAVVKYFSSS